MKTRILATSFIIIIALTLAVGFSPLSAYAAQSVASRCASTSPSSFTGKLCAIVFLKDQKTLESKSYTLTPFETGTSGYQIQLNYSSFAYAGYLTIHLVTSNPSSAYIQLCEDPISTNPWCSTQGPIINAGQILRSGQNLILPVIPANFVSLVISNGDSSSSMNVQVRVTYTY